jgi:hypothetical protein
MNSWKNIFETTRTAPTSDYHLALPLTCRILACIPPKRIHPYLRTTFGAFISHFHTLEKNTDYETEVLQIVRFLEFSFRDTRTISTVFQETSLKNLLPNEEGHIKEEKDTESVVLFFLSLLALDPKTSTLLGQWMTRIPESRRAGLLASYYALAQIFHSMEDKDEEGDDDNDNDEEEEDRKKDIGVQLHVLFFVFAICKWEWNNRVSMALHISHVGPKFSENQRMMIWCLFSTPDEKWRTALASLLYRSYKVWHPDLCQRMQIGIHDPTVFLCMLRRMNFKHEQNQLVTFSWYTQVATVFPLLSCADHLCILWIIHSGFGSILFKRYRGVFITRKQHVKLQTWMRYKLWHTKEIAPIVKALLF